MAKPKDLDRFFVKLAFYTEPKGNWIVVRRHRMQPQIIDKSEVDTFRAPEAGYATFFDAKAFLKGLKRRRGK